MNRSASTPRIRRRWRMSALSMLIATASLAGVGVALYPETAQWFSTQHEAQQIARYGDAVKSIGPASRLDALREAHAYNAALDSHAAVKADQRIPVDDGKTLPTGYDYAQLLRANRFGLMGRIIIPTIGADLPIFHGTSDATLEQGVGHLEGTALPVGGNGTHAVLAGHRGLASAALFTHLDQVVAGDSFTIATFGETLNYRVTSVKVVDPDETKSLDAVPGKDLVTLVTCTPIGVNSQRILVTGERVLPTPASAATAANRSPAGPGFPWWAVGIGASVLGAAAYVWWSGLPVPPRRSTTARRPRRGTQTGARHA